jgi:hypothetical protein
MRSLLDQYKKYFSNEGFLYSFFLSVFMLVASIFVDFYAAQYATVSASGPVTDIILSNTRVYDVDGFFVFGAMGLVAFIAAVCLSQPRIIPFTLKTIALFVFIRSIFITLTHIGPFPTEVSFDGSTMHYAKEIVGKNLFGAFFSGNDLFFSGHTGLPFLMAFICWDNKWLRSIFIALSVAFGITVLLGHLHYSIDVFAAFFITASIFNIARIFFKEDYVRSVGMAEATKKAASV